MKKTSILLILLVAGGQALAQDSFSSVEERMTGKEFMATGLHKLTEEELNELNRWLRDHSVATLENRVANTSSYPATDGTGTGISTDSRGFKAEQGDKTAIVARLVGDFGGWDGETIFRLDNGMVWKQAESDKFFVSTVGNPTVTIDPAMFGTWRLSVEGYNKSVRVERIQ